MSSCDNQKTNCCMTPSEAVAVLSALSLAIAKGKSSEEVDILATYFTQIGDTLATIAVSMECSEGTGVDIV